MAVSDSTSITLLERIRDPGNHDAWERFAAFCQPVICRYAGSCARATYSLWAPSV